MERKATPNLPDTIAAVATAPGRGGIGVIRVSGTGLAAFAQALTGRVPEPRMAGFGRFRDAQGRVIDEGVSLYFPAPQSFTGEDVLELQGHGGPVVMKLLLARCLELGARLAEPGEFSKRAFLNGKIDLAQAEGVADLIDATTAAAARSAVRSMSGDFSKELHRLSDQLIDLRMLVEATLDFPEEEIDFLDKARAFERLTAVCVGLKGMIDRASQGALLRSGINVVLVGQPNVGKSSLLNALAGEDRAIVHDVAGTTRDAVRETIQLEGIPVHVIDTAGLRESDDPVERIGIERSWREIERADAIVLMVDARLGIADADHDINRRLPTNIPRLTVFNKIDLVNCSLTSASERGNRQLFISVKLGLGLDLLREALLGIVGWHPTGEEVPLARERHLVLLRTALSHAQDAFHRSMALELFAEELRLAHECIAEITGEFNADDLLGVIFSRFCIGK